MNDQAGELESHVQSLRLYELTSEVNNDSNKPGSLPNLPPNPVKSERRIVPIRKRSKNKSKLSKNESSRLHGKPSIENLNNAEPDEYKNELNTIIAVQESTATEVEHPEVKLREMEDQIYKEAS